MLKSKKIKTLLFTLALSVVSMSSVQAATYTVASGDSLYNIGKLFNINYTNIMKNNNLSNSMIYPGQALQINAPTYTVKTGDSLYLIAKNHGVSLYSLRKANNKWSNSIYPGQALIIPKVTPEVAKTTINTTNQPSLSSKNITTSISYTASDIDLLSRLIKAEAENQPYSAKVAVGAVVLNRVKDNRFPNTIKEVIYEKSYGYYQFTPVENGFINKAANAESIKAAKEALSGSDPTKGAVYYFDDSTTNTWLWSKPIAIRIDRMVYTY